MKKLLFVLSTGLFCCCISCSDSGGSKMSATAQKNVETAKAIGKAVETGDVSKLGDYIAVDAVDHANPMGDIKGLDSIKAAIAKIHTMASDMKSEELKTLADDEYVFGWVRYTGTTTTADMGMPVGTKYDMTALHVSKYKDGKVTEHWEYMQPSDMMKMMGAPPPMAHDMNKMNMEIGDTAKVK